MASTRTISDTTKDYTIEDLNSRLREIVNELNTNRSKEHERARMKVRFLGLTSSKVCGQVNLDPTVTVRVLLDAADKYLENKELTAKERNNVHSFKYGLRLFSALNDTGKIDPDGKRLVKIRKPTKVTTKAPPAQKQKLAPSADELLYAMCTKRGRVALGPDWTSVEWDGAKIAISRDDAFLVELLQRTCECNTREGVPYVRLVPYVHFPSSLVMEKLTLAQILCGTIHTEDAVACENGDLLDLRAGNLRAINWSEGKKWPRKQSSFRATLASFLRVTNLHNLAQARVGNLEQHIADGLTKPASERAEWEGLVTLAEQERDAAKVEAEEAIAVLESLKKRVKKAEDAVENQSLARQEMVKLRQSVASEREKAEVAREELAELRKKYQSLETKRDLAEDCRELETQVHNLTEKNDRLLEANKELNQRLKKHRELQDKAESQVHGLEIRAKAAEGRAARTSGLLVVEESEEAAPAAVAAPAGAYVDAITVITDLVDGGLPVEYKLRFIKSTVDGLK